MNEPSVDFDFESIDPNLHAQIDDAAREMAAGALKSLLEWISGPNHKPEGVMLRAHVAMWFLLPEYSKMSQTELAEEIGVCKQSLGRQMSSFRDAFPGLKAPGMKSESARAIYRRVVLERMHGPKQA